MGGGGRENDGRGFAVWLVVLLLAGTGLGNDGLPFSGSNGKG